MRNQAGEKGETEEARAEAGIGEATERRNREEKERKKQRLSSRNRKRSGRKKADRKGKSPKAEGKHLRNSCGSESGKGERKQTESRVRRTEKECMGNQAGEKEETEEARAKAGTGEADVRRNQEEEERKKQRLSSQNRKKSGRKKANWKGKDRKRKHEVST